MTKRLSTVWAVVFVCFMFWGSAWAMKAAPVSPVGEEGVAVIGQNCPQFSWSYVEGAVGYEVVVFEGEERLSYEEKSSFSEALIEKVIASPGLTWAPEGGGCLKSGKGYVWYVRAVDAKGPGIWSEGARFRVDEKAMVEALREPVQEVVREYFSGEQVVKEKLVGLEGKIREEVKRELEGASLIGVGSTPKVLAVEGPSNTFYGQGAGAVPPTGVANSFFGVNAGNKTTTGNYNTFLGYYAGFSNTTASYNTFLGNAAGCSNTTANNNTFLGNYAGYYHTTGNSNIFLGYYAGYSNITGAGNVFLGYNAGYSEMGSNKLYIDNSATPTPLIYGEFDTNLVVINGVLSIGSSREYKENIDQLRTEKAIETLHNLNPVEFSYKATPSERHVGFISEEVPESLTTRDRKAVSPMDIVAVLTKVVQEQQESLKELKTRNELLEQRLLALEGKTMAGR